MSDFVCIVEPLYYGHFGTLILVLITEVSSIQRSLNTLQYYIETQNGVLITEVSSIQRSLNTLQYYIETQNGVLITEVSSIQRSLNTLQYYIETQNGVLITEVSSIQRSLNTLQYYIGTQNGRGFCYSEVCNKEAPLYLINTDKVECHVSFDWLFILGYKPV